MVKRTKTTLLIANMPEIAGSLCGCADRLASIEHGINATSFKALKLEPYSSKNVPGTFKYKDNVVYSSVVTLKYCSSRGWMGHITTIRDIIDRGRYGGYTYYENLLYSLYKNCVACAYFMESGVTPSYSTYCSSCKDSNGLDLVYRFEIELNLKKLDNVQIFVRRCTSGVNKGKYSVTVRKVS